VSHNSCPFFLISSPFFCLAPFHPRVQLNRVGTPSSRPSDNFSHFVWLYSFHLSLFAGNLITRGYDKGTHFFSSFCCSLGREI
jgi:hypothetical protein